MKTESNPPVCSNRLQHEKANSLPPQSIENRAKFNIIRYSQVWEDADLLIEALNLHKTDTVLSIASAGDNAFALAAQSPAKVYAIDLSEAQIACCEMRRAMYRQLSHGEHLVFGGVIRGKMDRAEIFDKLEMPAFAKEYWLNNFGYIKHGFMALGKFEKYFATFRKKALPLVHSRRNVNELLSPKTEPDRRAFYNNVWNNRRWQIMFRIFFSRFMMGRLGRDKEFFKFVEGSVADKILTRTEHALTTLDPAQNPYLQFILNGEYTTALPYSLREESYDQIKANLDNIEFRKVSIETFASEFDGKIDAFNLSDIFEYMTQDAMDSLYETILQKAAPGARFAYWNMLAPRKCSDTLMKKYGVTTDASKNDAFLMKDKAFFYSKFYLDTI